MAQYAVTCSPGAFWLPSECLTFMPPLSSVIGTASAAPSPSCAQDRRDAPKVSPPGDAARFTEETYESNLLQRFASSAQARTTSIEWSFGIVGVLLAAAAATVAQDTFVPPLLSFIALALAIPLAALATVSHAYCRGISVVSSHVTQSRFWDVLPPRNGMNHEEFDKHLARVAVQVDLQGGRVQTKRSLFTNVLLMGPGYLFVGVLAFFIYSWLTFRYATGGMSGVPAVLVTTLTPTLVLLAIIWIVWSTTLKGYVANLTEARNCPICAAQGDVDLLLRDGKILTGFEPKRDQTHARA
jgi:hypothetical protein